MWKMKAWPSRNISISLLISLSFWAFSPSSWARFGHFQWPNSRPSAWLHQFFLLSISGLSFSSLRPMFHFPFSSFLFIFPSRASQACPPIILGPFFQVTAHINPKPATCFFSFPLFSCGLGRSLFPSQTKACLYFNEHQQLTWRAAALLLFLFFPGATETWGLHFAAATDSWWKHPQNLIFVCHFWSLWSKKVSTFWTLFSFFPHSFCFCWIKLHAHFLLCNRGSFFWCVVSMRQIHAFLSIILILDTSKYFNQELAVTGWLKVLNFSNLLAFCYLGAWLVLSLNLRIRIRYLWARWATLR